MKLSRTAACRTLQAAHAPGQSGQLGGTDPTAMSGMCQAMRHKTPPGHCHCSPGTAPRGQDASGSAACGRFGAVLPCREVNAFLSLRRSFRGCHPQEPSAERGIRRAVKRTERCCSSSRREPERTRDLLLCGKVHCQGDAGTVVWGRCCAGAFRISVVRQRQFKYGRVDSLPIHP